MLRAESDTAARLRKNHSEMGKTISQLESLNRELQERSRATDGEKAQLEKELLLLQSTLDSERRNNSLGSEEIRELQGNAFWSNNQTLRVLNLCQNLIKSLKMSLHEAIKSFFLISSELFV